MRYLLIILFIFNVLNISVAQTIIKHGAKVKGTWLKSDSPILINGIVEIEKQQSLTIEAGTEILFIASDNILEQTTDFDYEKGKVGALIVNGTLIAKGSENELIKFSKQGTEKKYWGIILFTSSSKNSELSYCKIQNAGCLKGFPQKENLYSGAISTVDNDVKLTSNIISSNLFYGIEINDGEVEIAENQIFKNVIGITILNAEAQLTGNIIWSNSYGIHCKRSKTEISNNTIVLNKKYGIFIEDNSDAKVYSSIIWKNATATKAKNSTLLLGYCLINNSSELNFENIANIFNADPLFYNEEESDFRLTKKSPCIRKGRGGCDIGSLSYKELEPLANQTVTANKTKTEGTKINDAPQFVSPNDTLKIASSNSTQVAAQSKNEIPATEEIKSQNPPSSNPVDYYTKMASQFERDNNSLKASFAFDTLAFIYQADTKYQEAIEAYKKSLEYAQPDDAERKTVLLSKLANCSIYSNNVFDAIDYYNQAIDLQEDTNTTQLALLHNNLGIIYATSGAPDEAIENYKKALEIYKANNDAKGITKSLYQIAEAGSQGGNYEFAIETYNELLNENITISDKTEQLNTLNNLSALFFQSRDYSRSKELLNKALSLISATELPILKSRVLVNFGNIHFVEAEYLQAVNKYAEAIKLKTNYLKENPFDSVDIQRSISLSYLNMGNANYHLGKNELAYKNFDLAAKIANKYGFDNLMLRSYEAMAELSTDIASCDTVRNIYRLYFDNRTDNETIGDEQIAEFQLQYNREKELNKNLLNELIDVRKQNLSTIEELNLAQFEIRKQNVIAEAHFKLHKQKILLLNTENERIKTALENSNLKIKQRNLLILLSLVALLFSIGFVLFFIAALKRKKKDNLQLQKQQEIITKQNVEITEQNSNLQQQTEEITAQRDEITEQRNQLKEQHDEITSSIVYAQRIQAALIPSEKEIQLYFPRYFVFFKPRNIVSGDFYWVKKIDTKLYFAVADCTGHGIPGAFMSLLGIAYLNEIVRTKTKTPAQVLEQLRSKIKTALHQRAEAVEQKDGMDIAFLSIDLITKKLEYAGAYNPLVIIRQNELQILKADRQPIGVYPIESDFNNQEFQLERNDSLYLFTDGFSDQIGGNNNRKFMIKNLKELIFSIRELPMTEQKNNIENVLKQWKGSNEQIDDILIVGLKIP